MTKFGRLFQCEKITDKMEKIVEDLTTGQNASMELNKQPESITKGFNLTKYAADSDMPD